MASPAQADTCTGQSATPDEPSSSLSIVPTELVRDLLGWIGAHSDYDVAAAQADPPEIRLCDTGDDLPYRDGHTLVETGEIALYDPRRKLIHLVRPWHPDQPRDQSVLLHELVHHVQLTSRSWYCLQETEWQAYRLQEKWLAEAGIDPKFDWLWIHTLSVCPRDVHP